MNQADNQTKSFSFVFLVIMDGHEDEKFYITK